MRTFWLCILLKTDNPPPFLDRWLRISWRDIDLILLNTGLLVRLRSKSCYFSFMIEWICPHGGHRLVESEVFRSEFVRLRIHQVPKISVIALYHYSPNQLYTVAFRLLGVSRNFFVVVAHRTPLDAPRIPHHRLRHEDIRSGVCRYR